MEPVFKTEITTAVIYRCKKCKVLSLIVFKSLINNPNLYGMQEKP